MVTFLSMIVYATLRRVALQLLKNGRVPVGNVITTELSKLG